ncbi:MAG: transketolase [Alphaproteobacteria bacterium]
MDVAKRPAAGTAGSVTQRDMANAIRALAMDAVEKAKSGHPGMPMGMADAATVLFTQFLKYDPADPHWPDRDRFVLSAGHGSMLLYALLYLTGYGSVGIEDIKNFRQLKSRTPGHPEIGHTDGVETTTGPLGQGFANAVGMALAERMLAARYGAEIVDHFTYVIAGDGCLMEGVSQEAAALAGHLRLSRLIVLWDDNSISIDGPTSLAMSDDQPARFRALGWHVQEVDGHDPDAVAAALRAAQASPLPSLVACRTTIAYGAPKKAGTAASHGSPLGAEEIAGAREKLGWPYAPFEVPEPILAAWRAAGRRGAADRTAWDERRAVLPGDVCATFDRAMSGRLPEAFDATVRDLKRRLVEEAPKLATRQSSQKVLEALVPAVPELIGGSADLTGSNLTQTKAMQPVTADDYSGRYVFWGVREHGMGAAMNGIALHGGLIPYGGTFLVFSDYCRPAIRLSALMKARVVWVMTHDSIGLGEDGPTHQPIEHLASLRAIPRLLVLRPADAVETAECWAIALESTDRPSLLALTRQGLPALRRTHHDENLCARGAYRMAEAEGGPARVTLFATGSEVAIAMAARETLQAEGVPTTVVSVPSWELFAEQPAGYRTEILAQGTVRVAVEAGVPLGWERFVGTEGTIVGIGTFGESAPGEELYEHFGITAGAVADAARAGLS